MPSQRFRSWRLPPPGGIPLRVVLIAPFLLLVLVTAGLAGYSYHAIHEQMGALTGRLLQETGRHIEQDLDNWLGTARQLVKTNVAALRLGILDARNPPALEAYFFQQAATFPTINGVMLANEHKDFVGAARREQGWAIRVYDGARRDGLHNYQVDAQGHRQQLLWLDTGFDPHDDPPGNPWYAAVRNAGKPLWRLVVGEIEAGQTFLMLVRMAPFNDANGKFQGVTAVSLYLPQIGHFLDGLRVSKTGQAFIVDRDGLLIATSTGEPPFYRQPEAGRDPLKLRLAAVESQNPITRAASRYLVDTAGGFQRLTGFRQFSAKLNDRAYFLQIAPFGDENLDWRIIMAVPETDVMEQIDADMAKIIALHGAVLALMLLMGLLISGRIARPILKLNADARRLARGDFLESCATSLIVELRQLIDSFKYMVTRLRESFSALQALNQALADHQQNLEAEIARRTEMLRQSETVFRNAFEKTAVGMALVSPSGRILQVNNALCEMLGYSEAELREFNFERITFPDDLQKDWNLARQVLAGAITWYQLEKRYIHKQGHSIWCLLSASLVRDADGEPLYSVGQVQDITERKRAEENLRVALHRMEVLISSLYAGVLLVSNDGRVEFANQAFCDLFDLTETPDDLCGLTLPEMLQKIQEVYASPAEALARIQDIVALGQPVNSEEVAMRGGRLLVRDFIPILMDGQRYGRLWHHVDITEHRQMEEALREMNQHLEQRVMERTADLSQAMALLNQEMRVRQRGEERLTQALRAARAGAWEWNATTSEAIWSDGNYRVLGLTPGSIEARYENWLRCLHPEDRAEADRQVAQSMAQSGELNIEFRVVWPDGGIHWLNDIGQMQYDSAGQPVGMYGIQIDITERKRAELVLRETEALYRQLVENQPDLICRFLPDTTLTFVNTAYARFFGHPPEELLGKRFIEFLDAEAQADVWWHLAALTPTAPARQYEHATVGTDGVTCWHLWHDFAFFDDRGKVTSFQSVGLDITARKQAEIALLETMRLLEREVQARSDQEVQLLQARKLEAVGRLTGGIAHDFNNLLTVIKGNLEILRGQGGDWIEPDQALLIEDALSAARQGAELTVGLLAFSRQQPLRAQRTRVYRIVQALERLLERVLGPAIILRVEIDPTLPDVMADPGQLQAALMNLMLNAQDAMPEGGTLDVRTATVDVRRGTAAPVANLAPGRYVVVMVADSGIGMDADTLARACEPFFTTKPIGKGTGLGLSTVYGFAAQSHGGIAIESQPGQGTTVRLFLPALDPSSVRTARVAQALPSPPRGTETILVVEDHARVRRLACRYLHDLGYTVVEATNAEEAIAILETEPDIQMVFSDIVMPGGLDGYDLANWIATHRPTVKCLLATGYHDQARAAPTGDSPPPPVLAKPYSREQLAHQLRQLLDDESGTSDHPLP